MSTPARPWTAPHAAEHWRTNLLRWLPAAAFLCGLGLRASLLARPGLHPDEALYASWALRIADGSDPALLGVAVDKPPFLIYTLAAVFSLAGAGAGQAIDFTWLVLLGRLAGVIASVLSMGLLYAIVRQIYGRQTALLALAGYAVSPLTVRLAPTLFTDTWLVLWVLFGVWAAVGRRAWLAGLACGLAYATKQQALLFIPLIVSVFLLADSPGGSGRVRQGPTADADKTLPSLSSSSLPQHGRQPVPRLHRRHLRGLVSGFLLIATIVLWWDSLRWQWLPSYWERSMTTYGAVGLAAAQALPKQALKWTELLGYVLGSPLLTASLAAALPVVGWTAWRSRHSWRARFDRLWLIFAVVYLALHLLTTIAPWDRYAFALAPILILLWARGLEQGLAWMRSRWDQRTTGVARWQRYGQPMLLTSATALLLHAAVLAAGSRLPVGDMRAYDGAPAVAAYLRQEQPSGAILYHHWLGWHYAFYLYGAPVELRWWEAPQDLAAKAAAGFDQPQFMAIPAGRDAAPVQQALAAAGVDMEPALAVRHDDGAPSLTLYRLHVLARMEDRHGQ